ncbi:MAG TPA: 4-hydroxy-tetrahydrodipicolinate synthase, partial [Polyangiaceae bacterium]
TPFREGAGEPIDWDAFDALVEAQVAGGVAGIVPCGTTGESPTLTHEEQEAVIARAVARAKKRIQVVAGTGSNSTREAVAASQKAERAGADAVMIVVPYYNRPTQEGLYRHFVEVAKSVTVPVVAYNVPARSSADLLPETLARIAEAAPNVVATKEATGNVLRAQKIAQTIGHRMTVLCGDDALTLPMCAVGARGVISVTANVLPAEVARATRLALEGPADQARRAHLALLHVHEAMFLEASPAPVKAAMASRGMLKDVVRGPIAPCTDGTRKAIVAALDAYPTSTRGER